MPASSTAGSWLTKAVVFPSGMLVWKLLGGRFSDIFADIPDLPDDPE
jgi:hypothetical protein